MASSESAPAETNLPADAIIDLMVLAYSRSEIGEVGNATLRASIRSQFRMMHRGESIDLEPLWWILADHPKFEPELATPPACKFKTWESLIGYEVRLPMALFDADSKTIAKHAKNVDIPDAEVRALIAKHVDGPEQASKGKGHQSDDETAPASGLTGKVIALAGVALLLFGFAGFMVYGYLNPNSFKTVEMDFAALPVEKPRKLGQQVVVTLSDPTWRNQATAEKKKQLEQALDAASAAGVTGIIMLTPDKKPVASVALDGKTSKVIYNIR